MAIYLKISTVMIGSAHCLWEFSVMAIKKLKLKRSEQQMIAENLRCLFENRKVSEAEVAQTLNIPVMTIRRLLSGETTDPRVFTLKTVADYFNVPVDALIDTKNMLVSELTGNNKPVFLPLLDWATAEKIKSVTELDLGHWKDWHPISLTTNCPISDHAFALESRPSMYPRFQQGTVFIIDPHADPSDGDIVLVRIKKNNELTLRELTIDPPEWKLHPVVSGSTILEYSATYCQIVGVVLLTLLYNKKARG